eukprot:COSAG02_NODE_644_length_18993_cov_6.626389_17_plen_468_part_00
MMRVPPSPSFADGDSAITLDPLASPVPESPHRRAASAPGVRMTPPPASVDGVGDSTATDDRELEVELLAQHTIAALRRRAMELKIDPLLVEETIEDSTKPHSDLVSLIISAQHQEETAPHTHRWDLSMTVSPQNLAAPTQQGRASPTASSHSCGFSSVSTVRRPSLRPEDPQLRTSAGRGDLSRGLGGQARARRSEVETEAGAWVQSLPGTDWGSVIPPQRRVVVRRVQPSPERWPTHGNYHSHQSSTGRANSPQQYVQSPVHSRTGRATSPERYIQSPVRRHRGGLAQHSMRCGTQEEQVDMALVTLDVPRSEWQTQMVDVERTIMEPMAVRHTTPKTRLVPRTVVTASGPTVVLEQEAYEATEIRVVDVPVTVVEQEEREMLAMVYHREQRVLPVTDGTSLRQQQPSCLRHLRTVQDGQVVDKRSMVGAPGSTEWRFENRTAETSTSAPFRTPGMRPRKKMVHPA